VSPAVLAIVLNLAGVVVAVAVTWGALMTKIAAMREMVSELRADSKASAQSNGVRLGALEGDMKLVKYLSRHPTEHGGIPKLVRAEESDEHPR